MHRISVYVDTSVFGGVHDDEFAEASQRFFDRVRKGEYLVMISSITTGELTAAPEKVRQILESMPEGSLVEIPDSEEAKDLAEAYIAAGALGRASSDDAFHVATATVAGVDLVLSWNFRHIVNYERIRRFNGVNIAHGYRQIEIRSPLEVGLDSQDQGI